MALLAGSIGLVAIATWAWNRPSGCSDLGPTSSYSTGSVTRIDCAPLFVVNANGTFSVLLALSPHLANEMLVWDDEAQVFVSRSHGETFGISGAVIQGPALHDMWRCPTRTEGGHLRIDAPEDAKAEDLVAICEATDPTGSSSA